MENKLFDTEKKREAAIATFKTGMDTSFWHLMKQILERNVEFLTRDILSGKIANSGKNATKEQMDRLRDNLRIHKEIMNTPESMIEKLTSSEEKEPILDPYYTKEQLKEERKLKE